MKKTSLFLNWIILIALILIVLSGCAKEDKQVKKGTYFADEGFANITIGQDETFILTRDASSSYAPSGDFEIDGDKLFLYIDDEVEKETIKFEIDGERLIFKSGKFLEEEIKKGSKFVYREKEIAYEWPEIKRDTNLGAVLPEIIYESDKQLIFYNYMGVFIYDLVKDEMLSAIRPSESEFTIKIQGNQITSADFNEKNNVINIYQIGEKSSDYFYKYDINSAKLYEYPIEELNQEKEDHQITGKMDTSDWTAWNLIYTSKLTGEKYYPLRSIIE